MYHLKINNKHLLENCLELIIQIISVPLKEFVGRYSATATDGD